jgi:hypothetical protein
MLYVMLCCNSWSLRRSRLNTPCNPSSFAALRAAGFQPAGVKMMGGSSSNEKVLVFPARDQIKYIDVRVGSG